MDGLDRTMAQWLGEEPTSRMRQAMETIKLVRLVGNKQRECAYVDVRAMGGNLTIQSRNTAFDLHHDRSAVPHEMSAKAAYVGVRIERPLRRLVA